MMTPRLGYACINTVIQEDVNVPKKSRYCVNRSCIAKTFREKGVDYAIQLAKSNLEAVLKVLEWNERNSIRLYRMSSDMFPHITNPEFIPPKQKYAYPLDPFQDLFDKIGKYAKKHKHRLTFHPGQFNQMGFNPMQQQPRMDTGQPCNTVWVGNLPDGATESDLTKYFSFFGTVENVKV